MSSKKILIVEDDANISKLVDYNLTKAGFKTSMVSSGEDAIATLYRDKFDLVVLDIMLPGVDGLEICKKIKNDIISRLLKINVLS